MHWRMVMKTHHPSADLELIWGADAIARELGISTRECFYLMKEKRIPAKKVGRRWCSSRRGLREHFADVLVADDAAA